MYVLYVVGFQVFGCVYDYGDVLEVFVFFDGVGCLVVVLVWYYYVYQDQVECFGFEFGYGLFVIGSDCYFEIVFVEDF